jgi:hypothetical protein
VLPYIAVSIILNIFLIIAQFIGFDSDKLVSLDFVSTTGREGEGGG